MNTARLLKLAALTAVAGLLLPSLPAGATDTLAGSTNAGAATAGAAAPADTTTPAPTDTGSVTPTDTSTLGPTDTATPPPTDTATPPPTDTPTPPPTDTATPTPTDTPTAPPTDTATPTPTDTATVPPTSTATVPPTTIPTTAPAPSPSASSPGTVHVTPPPKRPHPKGLHLPPRPHPKRTLRPPAPQRPHPKGLHLPPRPHPKRKPWPVTLTVKVVPALANVHFMVDKQLIATNDAGIATFTAEHDFLQHTLTVVDSSFSTATADYRFGRWEGQRDPNAAFSKTVTGLPLRSDYAITAAFGLQALVQPRLVDENNNVVDPSRVTAIWVKSDTGQLVWMNPTGGTLLDVSRPAMRHGVLVSEPASYSVQSVIVRGANVVDSGRQVFHAGVPVTFVTQFHNITISGYDALFGSARGTSAVVTFPDGGTETLRFDAQHQATLNDIPRGTYTVAVKAGDSVAAAQQFTASKDKTLAVAVISPLDMSVLAGSLLMLAIALWVIGRRQWQRRIIRRFRRSLDDTPSLVDTREGALL